MVRRDMAIGGANMIMKAYGFVCRVDCQSTGGG